MLYFCTLNGRGWAKTGQIRTGQMQNYVETGAMVWDIGSREVNERGRRFSQGREDYLERQRNAFSQ